MTVATYRLKLSRVNTLKLKVSTRIPAQFEAGNGVSITKTNGVYTVDLDYSELGEILNYQDALEATTYLASWESLSGTYSRQSVTNIKADFATTFGGLYQPLDATLTALAALDSTAGILTQTGADTFERRTLTGTANEIAVADGDGVSGDPTVSIASGFYSTAHIWTALQSLTINQNASTNWTVTNTSTGTSALASYSVINSVGVGAFGIGGTGYTGFTALQNRAYVFADTATDGIAIFTEGADPINFYVAGTLAGSFSGAGVFSLVTPLALTSGGVGSATASGARTNLGSTAVGDAVFIAANAAAARTAIGAVIGTDVQGFDADLAALAANSTDGLWAHTGAGTGSARTLTAPAAGFTITNPAGIAGNPTFVLANDLGALEGLASTGIARRTGSDAWSVGTAVSNAELATMAAYTFKGNNTGSSATPTDVDIAALTTKASPAAGDYVMLSDQAASGAWKKATVSSVASAGSVGSLNGATGAVVWSVVKQIFTANGTYTPTTGMKFCIIEVVGGGGGGGSASGTSAQSYGGGGGGSGGYSRLVATAATVGASQTVTIGAAGSGGASGTNNGTAGADTSVGSICIGKGGSFGLYGSSGQVGASGDGGVAGTGDLVATGMTGTPGLFSNSSSIVFPSGSGGSSHFGGGGKGVHAAGAATAGTAGGNYGGGGAGAQAHNTASAAAGGNGSAGVVFITEFLVN